MSAWPHAPPHYLGGTGVYMITAGTYLKQHFFEGDLRLGFIQDLLLDTIFKHGWQVQAWAVFPNHYHFIAGTSALSAASLPVLIREAHSISARWVNQQDGTSGRKVWYNYMESHITKEASHLARLHYVHANAVHHKLVSVANQYPWCSAAWFERVDTSARIKTVYGFPCSRLLGGDEF